MKVDLLHYESPVDNMNKISLKKTMHREKPVQLTVRTAQGEYNARYNTILYS